MAVSGITTILQRAMTLIATARSIPGTLRQEVVIDGQHRLITDEPVDVGGDGSAPSPHELLPAALASCISTTLIMYARRKEWDLDDVVVDVEYDHRSTPRTFHVAIDLTGDLDGAQLARLEKVARSCPVRRSIGAGFHFEERIATRRGARLRLVPGGVR
jgi:putative redox protein